MSQLVATGRDGIFARAASMLQKLGDLSVRITARRNASSGANLEARSHLDASSLLERVKRHDVHIDCAAVYRTPKLPNKLRLMDELDRCASMAGSVALRPSPPLTPFTWCASSAAGLKSSLVRPFGGLKLKSPFRTQFRYVRPFGRSGGLCSACSAAMGQPTTIKEKNPVRAAPQYA